MSVTATSHAGASWCAFTAGNRPGWSARVLARLSEVRCLSHLTGRVGWLQSAKARCQAYDRYEQGFRADFIDRVLRDRSPSTAPAELARLVDTMAPRRCLVTPDVLERILARVPLEARVPVIDPQAEALLMQCRTAYECGQLERIEASRSAPTRWGPEAISLTGLDDAETAFQAVRTDLMAMSLPRQRELTEEAIADRFQQALRRLAQGPGAGQNGALPSSAAGVSAGPDASGSA